jgi:hypothetical protein
MGAIGACVSNHIDVCADTGSMFAELLDQTRALGQQLAKDGAR